MKRIQITFLLILSLIYFVHQTPVKTNVEENKKFIREYEKFMDAYCGEKIID